MNPFLQSIPQHANRRLALWTFATFALLIGWDVAGLDLTLARLQAGPHGFPLQGHWLLTTVLHQGALPLTCLLIIWIAAGVWWPTLGLQRLDRATRAQWAGASLLALLVIDLMKLSSHTSCPWEVAEFGGMAVHVSHWAWGLLDGGAGHCFPAGHASAGFVFVAGFFAWRRQSPILARRWLAGGLLWGSVLGVSQQLRGAHYLSHTLWTAWLCWAVAWTVHMLPVVVVHREPVASKVPPVIILFWVVNVLTMTIGETAGDALSRTLALGYGGATLVFLFVFAVALVAQLRTPAYSPLVYWGGVAASTTAGTTLADYLDSAVGLGHLLTALLLCVALAILMESWRRSIGRISFKNIRSRAEELFYWAAFLLVSTLGTALGECIAEVTGFVPGALLLVAALLILALLHAKHTLSTVLLFWATCIVTRPLGATLGDTLTEARDAGGFALERMATTGVIAALILLTLLFMSKILRDRGAPQAG